MDPAAVTALVTAISAGAVSVLTLVLQLVRDSRLNEMAKDLAVAQAKLAACEGQHAKVNNLAGQTASLQATVNTLVSPPNGNGGHP